MSRVDRVTVTGTPAGDGRVFWYVRLDGDLVDRDGLAATLAGAYITADRAAAEEVAAGLRRRLEAPTGRSYLVRAGALDLAVPVARVVAAGEGHRNAALVRVLHVERVADRTYEVVLEEI